MSILLAIALAMSPARSLIPTLVFSTCNQGPWQRVSANGQLLGIIPNTPLDPDHKGCYGFGHLIDGTAWTTSDTHFFTLTRDLTKVTGGGPSEPGAKVEQMVGVGSRHLYRIVRGDRLPRDPKHPRTVRYSVQLEEVNPRTWKVDRSWQLPGLYSDYSLGHLAVDLSEHVAYFATLYSPYHPDHKPQLERYGAVHRFDLVSGTFLPDLVSRPCSSSGIIVQPNGSVVVAYTDQVRRFAQDGKELNAYTPGSMANIQGAISPGSDPTKTFWVQGYDPESVGLAHSTMYEVDVDSGLIRRQFDLPNSDVQWGGPFIDPPSATSSLLVFSSLEQKPWQKVDATTGAVIGDVTGTPLDPDAGGTFGMGRLWDTASKRIWIAAETYFYTASKTLDDFSGGIVDDFFIAGQSGKHLYKIQPLPHTVTPEFIQEIDPVAWTVGRTWQLPLSGNQYGFGVLAVNKAETVAYFNADGIPSPGPGTVYRWDLTGNVAMTDLVSIGGVGMGGLIVLQDDTIVVGFTDAVRRYAPNGTLLNTYSQGVSPSFSTGHQGQLAHGSDASTFWMVQELTGSPSRNHVYQFNTVSGAILHDFTMPADGTAWDWPFAFVPGTECSAVVAAAGDDSTSGHWKWTAPSGGSLPSPANNPDDSDLSLTFRGGLSTRADGKWIEAAYAQTTAPTTGTFRIYDADYSVLATVGVGAGRHVFGAWATSAYFYITTKNPSNDSGDIRWYNSAGVQQGLVTYTDVQTGADPGADGWLESIAVTATDSIAFVTSGNSKKIYQVTLPGGVQSTFVTLPTSGGNQYLVNQQGQAVLVIPSTGDVLVSVTLSGTGVSTQHVLRYDSSGALQATYDIDVTNISGTFIVAIFLDVDGEHFWSATSEGGSTTVRFKRIAIAGGTEVENWTQDRSLGFGWDNAAYGVARIPCTMACPDPCEKAKIDEPFAAVIPPNGTDLLLYDRAFTLIRSITLDGTVGVALAPSSDGMWTCSDDGAGGSILNQYKTSDGTLVRGPITVADENGNPIVIAELGGCRALFVLDCDRMLTSDRAAHQLVEICLPATDADEQVAIVSKRYSLIVDPLDAQLVDGGKAILYVTGSTMAVWTLKSDSQTKVVGSAPTTVRWPTLLSDNSFWVYGGAFLGTSGDAYRFSRTGTLKMTVSCGGYIPEVFSLGLFNIWAGILTDICDCAGKKDGTLWLFGEDNPAVIPVSMVDGSTSPDKIILLTDIPFWSDGTASAVSLLEPSNGSGFSTTNAGPAGTKPKKIGKCDTTQGLSTVSPNAGCNPGGRGWTPTYTGASGTTPTCADPPDGERLTGKHTVYMMVDIYHATYPVSSSPTYEHIRVATVEMSGTTHWKQGVRSIGTIVRGFSDQSGNMKASAGTLYIADTGRRLFGGMLADSTKKFFARDEIAISMISDEGLRSGATPKMIGRGLCQGQSYGTPGEFRASFIDHLFSDGGSFSPDKKFPQWNYPLAYFSDAPRDMSRLFLPVILGEVSDEGARDEKTGEPSSKGKCPWRYTGMDGLGTAPGGEPWGSGIICMFASYQAISVYGSDAGGMGLFGRGATIAIVQASDTSEDDTGTTPTKNEQTVVTLPGAGDLSAVPTDEGANVHLFTPTGKVVAAITGVNNATKEVTINGSLDPSAAAGGVSWYIAMSDYVPKRVKIDLASRNGDDCMVFGHSGYIRPTPYEDIVSSDGNFRLTRAWFRGVLLDAHKAGEVTIAFNMIGVESKGDGSGLPIIDFYPAYCWAWDNMFLRQLQAPLGGLWPQTNDDVPLYSDGYSVTRQSTFAAMQAFTASRLGGYGLRISAYFDAGIGIRDAIQAFNDNGGCRTWIDGYGRVNVWMLDENVDTSAWTKIHHAPRVFGPVSQDRKFNETINYVVGGCDYDPEFNKFREDDLKSVDNGAIERNKGIRKPSKHFDLKLLANKSHAQWILDRQLFMNKDGPLTVDIDVADIGMQDHTIGTGFLFASDIMPSNNFRPMIITDCAFNVDRHTNRLTLLDLGADGAVDQLITPASQRWIATDDTSIAPIASDDTTIAPRAAA